jgi:hypothetical protein
MNEPLGKSLSDHLLLIQSALLKAIGRSEMLFVGPSAFIHAIGYLAFFGQELKPAPPIESISASAARIRQLLAHGSASARYEALGGEAVTVTHRLALGRQLGDRLATS